MTYGILMGMKTRQSRLLILVLVLTGNSVTAQEKRAPLSPDLTLGAGIFRDTRNTYKDAKDPGPVIEFRGRFEDALIAEGRRSVGPFGEEPSDAQGKSNLVKFYSWPKRGNFSKGTIVLDNPRYPDHSANDPSSAEPTREVKCYMQIYARTDSKPPEKFPLVQVNYTRPTDAELYADNGKPFRPRRFRHEVRVEFGGGYLNCSVWDLKSARVWTVGDVTSAFSPDLISFTAGAPSRNVDAGATQNVTPQSPVERGEGAN